jgi:hypothetical protein
MSKDVLVLAKEEYPQIYLSLRRHLNMYEDYDFKFRRKMIQNVPYLIQLVPEIINDILYLLRPKRYEAGTRIIKRGDNLNSLYFLKSGIIDIYVPQF